MSNAGVEKRTGAALMHALIPMLSRGGFRVMPVHRLPSTQAPAQLLFTFPRQQRFLADFYVAPRVAARTDHVQNLAHRHRVLNRPDLGEGHLCTHAEDDNTGPASTRTGG
jgi:hypothetical protein